LTQSYLYRFNAFYNYCHFSIIFHSFDVAEGPTWKQLLFFAPRLGFLIRSAPKKGDTTQKQSTIALETSGIFRVIPLQSHHHDYYMFSNAFGTKPLFAVMTGDNSMQQEFPTKMTS